MSSLSRDRVLFFFFLSIYNNGNISYLFLFVRFLQTVGEWKAEKFKFLWKQRHTFCLFVVFFFKLWNTPESSFFKIQFIFLSASVCFGSSTLLDCVVYVWRYILSYLPSVLTSEKFLHKVLRDNIHLNWSLKWMSEWRNLIQGCIDLRTLLFFS